MTKTYFISGHGNITFEEWTENYKSLIDKALGENAHFILGDFKGTDVLSMEYLKDKTQNVTIVHCFSKPRYKPDTFDLPSSCWKFEGGFKSDEERDMYMTQHSNEDIAWVRKGKENSGTAKNIKRRKLE